MRAPVLSWEFFSAIAQSTNSGILSAPQPIKAKQNITQKRNAGTSSHCSACHAVHTDFLIFLGSFPSSPLHETPMQAFVIFAFSLSVVIFGIGLFFPQALCPFILCSQGSLRAIQL